jgi:hypothetical protein
MKINSKDFRVREGDEVNLRKWPTNVEPMYKSKEHYQELLGEHVAQLSSLQHSRSPIISSILKRRRSGMTLRRIIP